MIEIYQSEALAIEVIEPLWKYYGDCEKKIISFLKQKSKFREILDFDSAGITILPTHRFPSLFIPLKGISPKENIIKHRSLLALCYAFPLGEFQISEEDLIRGFDERFECSMELYAPLLLSSIL